MIETTPKMKKPFPTKLALVIVGILALTGISFYVGGLSKEVQLLRSGVGGGQPSGAAGAPPERELGEVQPVSDTDHIKGSRNAKVALIEYSDFECPYCQGFHNTAQQVVDEYDGDVMWVYRHFPLTSIHSKAPKEAEASECAAKLGGNDAFWAFADRIFEITPANNGLNLDELPKIAEYIGLNVSEFNTCLDSGEMADVVNAQFEAGQKAGITGTPGNILMNIKSGETTFIPGALPFAQVSQAIDGLL